MHRLPEQDLDHVLEHTEGLWEQLRRESVLITGGTGFVGTWLLESLLWISDRLDLGVQVTALTRDPERFANAAPHLACHESVRLLRGNVIDFNFPDDTFPFVIHAATERITAPAMGQPLGSFAVDERGTRRVLEFACSHGTRRLLFTSSGAVYGRQPSELTNVPEEYAGAPATVDTHATYAHAKRISEFMCASYGSVYQFDVVIARLFAFVGPLLPLDANYAVGNFIRDALAGGPIRIAGDGTPYRSYLYSADLAIWLWTMLFRGKAAFPYNVGSPNALTIVQLAQSVVQATAPHAPIEVARKAVPGKAPERYVPDTTRAQELGLVPLIPVDEGIRRTAVWHRVSGRTSAAHGARRV
jgi:Nucleoside-diphosphate-sugar epimerases